MKIKKLTKICIQTNESDCNTEFYFRAKMEVTEVTGGELGSGTVVVSPGELSYDLGQQSGSFLSNAHIMSQGKLQLVVLVYLLLLLFFRI